ncbi:hypothetical protein PVW53_17680 [Seohaeicola sp. SP36]|uniref:hypothetical protein n=1 Tax=unclassified Seohaeicola TaxID=2641111 RepID=UPI00237BAC0A|nr:MULTISPECIES: hypothetical protein [unclassified Seohaeicola]MDD9709191.1 hypothetical protein [Seohaeicola sp. 4SK31]MDD9737358.1 hypothetical protein [Seohaeicola sp. SP36]
MEILTYILGSATGSALIVAIGLFFRDNLSRFVNSSFEFRFSKKLENLKSELQEKDTKLRSDLSSQEQELNRIASFLIAQKQDRESVVLRKRIEAAESVARNCQFLSRATMAVEMVKILKSEYLESASKNIKAQQSCAMLTETLKLKDFMSSFATLDPVPGSLYLPDRAQLCFKAYQTINLQAVTALYLAGLGQDTSQALKKDVLKNVVVPIVPNSKEGFDEFGDEFGFYWAQYFYDETFKSLRSLVNGDHYDNSDRLAVKNILIDSQLSQIEARLALANANISINSSAEQAKIEEVVKNTQT